MVEAAAISPQGTVYCPWKRAIPTGSVWYLCWVMTIRAKKNSFQANMKTRMPAVKMPGAARGRIILKKSLPVAASVHPGRVFQFPGQFPEEGRHDPDPQRKRQCDIGNDQSLVGIEPSQAVQDLPHGSRNGDLGKHGNQQKASHDERLVPDGKPRQGISRKKGEGKRSQRGQSRHDEAVFQKMQKIVIHQGGAVEIQRPATGK